MNVGVDVDEVVADLLTVWLDLYNREYNDNLTADKLTEWSMIPFVKEECGTKIYSYLERSDLYDNVLPLPGSLEGINKIRELGHRVIFVTSATTGHAGQKLIWLQKHGFLPGNKSTCPDYIECNDKSLIGTDILIDDRFETVKNFKQKAILFVRDHNKREVWPYSANGWTEVIEIIEKMSLIGKSGVKFNSGKPMFSLIPSYPITELAKLYTKGSLKYSKRNWELGADWSQMYDALQRHAWAWWGGEDIDTENGLHHLVSVAWNAFALLEYYKTHPERDDRPKHD